jgi:monoamine oxidase
MYLNAGPGRLPYHHTAILHYCNILGVHLEVYNMMTRANLFQTGEAWRDQAMVNRRIANDTRGWIADLLAKAVRGGSLDSKLGKPEQEKLLSLLSSFGDIDPKESPNYDYLGSSRSGYAIEPGVESCGELLEPLELSDLLDSRFWKNRFYQAEPVHGIASTCKVGWQANGRFREKKDQMYRGISYTTDEITQMWYPSYDYLGQKAF